MAKNLSLSQGVPTSKMGGLEQHNRLVRILRGNGLFMFPSQNRGYLALEKASGRYKNFGFFNVLYNKKPNKKVIKLTKV